MSSQLQGMQSYPQATFSQPTYQQPMYQQPTYQQPTYQQPVYQQNAYPQPAKASNPFDLGNEAAPIQAHMSRPLGASAGATNPTLVGNSSFGVPPQQPQQMYQPSVHQNHYMMQHVSNNMPEQLPNGMLPRATRRCWFPR
uniref:Uncharacterized protein n=1 Tax=Aegilops tauschii subsp. strangulata TaxID=200361 RepID=A0A453NQ57_AEGTS